MFFFSVTVPFSRLIFHNNVKRNGIVIAGSLVEEAASTETKAYYLYLTTFLNQDKEYIERVCGQLLGGYTDNPSM